jgi:hypothetical protein
MGTRSSFPGARAAERESDHSPPSSAEVKNAWSFISTPQYAFMMWSPVKAQGHLYLYRFLYVNNCKCDYGTKYLSYEFNVVGICTIENRAVSWFMKL